MRKVKVFFIGIIGLILLNACNQLLTDIEKDLAYWSSTVLIKKNEISFAGTDSEGYPCLPSEGGKTVILKLTNPQKYILKIPGAQGSPSDIVVFESGVKGADGKSRPKAGVDYELKQKDSENAELIYKEAFLKYSEWGSQNLSPTITLYNKEGRKFEQTYTFKLRANTPPPALEYRALCKTQDGGKWYYVLCFEVKDMDKKAGPGSTEFLHKDIASITLTPQGGTAQTLPLTVDGSGLDISGSGGLLLPADKVEKLTPADITTGLTPDELTAGNWIIRFKTDVEVKGAVKTYSFKLTDQKGLNSPITTASTSANRLPPVELYHNNIKITSEDEAGAHLINTGSASDAISLQARAQNGAEISGTIEKKSGSDWSSAGTVSGTTTAAVTLPALASGENEALYKITLKANAAGYSESGLQTFFVKLTKDLVVTFGVVDGQGGKIKADSYPETTTNSTIQVVYGSTVNFTATPNTGWEIDSWMGVQANPANSHTATLSNMTEAKNVAVKFKKKTYPVTFSVQGGNGSLRGSYNGNTETASGSDTKTLTVPYDESVTFTATPEEGYEVDSWTGVTPDTTPADKTKATLTVDGNKNVTVTFKKKTYTVTFRVVGGNGSLQGSYNGNTKTASGNNTKTFTVPHGSTVNFIATPGNPNQYKVGDWTCAPSVGFTEGQNGQASLIVTANTEVSVQFVQLAALTPQTLTIHGQNALGGSVTLPYTTATVQKSDIVLKFNEHTNIPFTIEPSAGLNLTAGVPQNLTINVAASPGNYPAWSKTVQVTRAQNDVANLASFKLNGELKTAPFAAEYTVASTTARVTDCTFDLNSAQATASVSPGGTVNILANGGTQFTITVKAQNGSTTQTVTFTVKRKTYPVRFSVQGGKGGSLKGVYNGSHQTASGSYIPNLSVPHGESVTFTATPEKGWDIESWTGVSSSTTTATLSNVTAEKTVRVKFKPGEFNLAGGGSDAWKQLKEEAAKPYGAHTILINGEIKATGGNNAGEITLGRNLIIKGTNSAVLDANNQSRIFKVESGKTLTLENITLKNGNAGGGNGGGVYVNTGGTLIMKDSSTITGCSARIGGGVYVNGTFKMQGGAKVDENNEVYLEPGKTITVTGALTHRPAARITPNEYTDGRVLATGAAAERDNFKVTPKNGTEYWRYKKKGDVIKFVKAELKVTFVEIKCVAEYDAGRQGEYYWTMKVDGQIIHERPESNLWKAGDGDTLSINKSFTRSFSYVPAQIPVNIEIWEDDNEAGGDDHIGTTKAKLTYDYDNDRWVWTYDGNQENGNQKKNPYIEINDGQEKSFTEEYRHSDGDTDVTMKIKWIDE